MICEGATTAMADQASQTVPVRANRLLDCGGLAGADAGQLFPFPPYYQVFAFRRRARRATTTDDQSSTVRVNKVLLKLGQIPGQGRLSDSNRARGETRLGSDEARRSRNGPAHASSDRPSVPP